MTAVGLAITVSCLNCTSSYLHAQISTFTPVLCSCTPCMPTNNLTHTLIYTQTYTYLAGLLQPGFCHLHNKASVVKLVICIDISGSQDIDIMHVCQIQSAMKLATLLGKLKQRAIYLMTKTCLTHGCFFIHHA